MIRKRGETWYMDFGFHGQRIRECCSTSSEAEAKRIEKARYKQLRDSHYGIKEQTRPLVFSAEARQWLESQAPHWSANSARIERTNVGHLAEHFGKMLLIDIAGDDISQYQALRTKQGVSPKTINLEVGALRAIMRKRRLWANIQPDVKMLRSRNDVGRALTADEQHRLLVAAQGSRSRSLYPAILVSLHSGLRNQELRLLKWRQIDLIERRLTVGKSKTAGGEGRIVPLSEAATAALQEWRTQFPNAQPEHYVFPSERYGLNGEAGYENGSAIPYEVRPDVPIGSWKVAWTAARKAAGVCCRWHDMRHTFVSAMAEGQASDATIMSLAGHLSRKMMERYSHTRNEAKRQAIAVLDSVDVVATPSVAN